MAKDKLKEAKADVQFFHDAYRRQLAETQAARDVLDNILEGSTCIKSIQERLDRLESKE